MRVMKDIGDMNIYIEVDGKWYKRNTEPTSCDECAFLLTVCDELPCEVAYASMGFHAVPGFPTINVP